MFLPISRARELEFCRSSHTVVLGDICSSFLDTVDHSARMCSSSLATYVLILELHHASFDSEDVSEFFQRIVALCRTQFFFVFWQHGGAGGFSTTRGKA